MSRLTTDWDRAISAPNYCAMYLKLSRRRGPENWRQHSALPWADRSNRPCNPLRRRFENEKCEAILLIDATNTFNILNRATALENIRRLCRSLHIPLSNFYQTPCRLFVDKKDILSQDGCTQVDPLAMLMYGIAIKSLILKLQTPRTVKMVR